MSWWDDIGGAVGNAWNYATDAVLNNPVENAQEFLGGVQNNVDNFLNNGTVEAQIVGAILGNGVGVSTGFGSGSPAGTNVYAGYTPPAPAPVPQSVIDNTVNNAAQTYQNSQPSPMPTNPSIFESGLTNNPPPPTGFQTPLSTYTPGSTSGLSTDLGATAAAVAPVAPAVVAPPPTAPPNASAGVPGTPAASATATAQPDMLKWLLDHGVEAAQAASILAGAGASLTSGKTMADAATEAANLQSNAAKEALKLQKDQFDLQRTDLAPWRDAGNLALKDLQGFDASNPKFGADLFKQDPGYSFRLNEGIKALENSASARGLLKSGNTWKALENYGQEAASQEYQNAFNRYQVEKGQRLNNLQSLAGVGQSAIQQTGQAGQNYANNAGSAYTGGANALAQGITGKASADASGYMGATNALNNGISGLVNNYMSQQWMNKLQKQGG